MALLKQARSIAYVPYIMYNGVCLLYCLFALLLYVLYLYRREEQHQLQSTSHTAAKQQPRGARRANAGQQGGDITLRVIYLFSEQDLRQPSHNRGNTSYFFWHATAKHQHKKQ